MNKGNNDTILRFIIMAVAVLSLLPTSLAFAQEEKQPVAEFIELEDIPFYQFWLELFTTWGTLVAENLVNALAFFVVIGVGYFVGRGVSGALSRALKKLFKDYLKEQLSEEDLKEKSSWSQITTLIPFTAKWFVWVYAFVIAIDLLGFAEASEWLGVLWTFIPNIIAFIILIAVGIIVSRIALKWLSEYKPDLFGSTGTMQILKSLVNAIIFAFVFGIGITQLGIGEEIIPIVFWTILAGIMGILVVSAIGLRHAVASWSFGESVKHLGVKKGAEIKLTDALSQKTEDFQVIQVGVTHTKVKKDNKIRLIPNRKFENMAIEIQKEAPEPEAKKKPEPKPEKQDEQTGQDTVTKSNG